LTQATEPAAAVEPHSFEVNVLLSDSAKKRFALSKETLIAACYVTGVAREGTNKECTDQIREEIALGEVALFKNVELKKDCVSPPVETHESELLINVFSGRKSSPQNLLDCDIYQGSLKDIQGRRLNLSCSLIGE
jgi:hypothetical protein